MYRYFMVCLGLLGLTGAVVTKDYLTAMLWIIIIIQDFEIKKLEGSNDR